MVASKASKLLFLAWRGRHRLLLVSWTIGCLIYGCRPASAKKCSADDGDTCRADTKGRKQDPPCRLGGKLRTKCDLLTIDVRQRPVVVESPGPDYDEDAEMLTEMLQKKQFRDMHPATALVNMHWRGSPVILKGEQQLCNLDSLRIPDINGDFKLPASLGCTNPMAKTNYHFRDQWQGQKGNHAHGFCNVTFNELADLFQGTKKEADLKLPKHWHGRLFPGSIPRVGFLTDSLAKYFGVEGQTKPQKGEPLLLFQGSGFWAESKGTRTPFHEDWKVQLIIPCAGSKLWYFSPSHIDVGDIPGTGPWMKSDGFKDLMEFAWWKSGSFDLCTNTTDAPPTWWTGYSGGRSPTVTRCTVGPGDILYTPYAYGHDVEALNSSVHITLRFVPQPSQKEREGAVQFQEWARSNRPYDIEDRMGIPAPQGQKPRGKNKKKGKKATRKKAS